MKRAIIVKCKKCTKEWYVRESREREFEDPITLTCPHCNTVYKKINYMELYVSKCSKFSILRLMNAPGLYKPQVRKSFTLFVFVLICILLMSIFFYIVMSP